MVVSGWPGSQMESTDQMAVSADISRKDLPLYWHETCWSRMQPNGLVIAQACVNLLQWLK